MRRDNATANIIKTDSLGSIKREKTIKLAEAKLNVELVKQDYGVARAIGTISPIRRERAIKLAEAKVKVKLVKHDYGQRIKLQKYHLKVNKK